MQSYPLKVGDEVAGVLFINYKTPHKFTPHQHQQLTLFVNSVAMAIYNVWLFAEERRRTEMARVRKYIQRDAGPAKDPPGGGRQSPRAHRRHQQFDLPLEQ